ncbi:hypothetical protein [Megasphaera cerevisiae]|nr:hypothetical protein [Megasphaera cerevisiae]
MNYTAARMPRLVCRSVLGCRTVADGSRHGGRKSSGGGGGAIIR